MSQSQQDKQQQLQRKLLEQLSVSPDVFVQSVDILRNSARAIVLRRGGYTTASFLDDRILAPNVINAMLPLRPVIEIGAKLENLKPLNFIFHTGHVGSTLVSRLLDETGLVLGLREPPILRQLAQAQDTLGKLDSLLSEPAFHRLSASMLNFMARGYNDTTQVIVKATSSTGRLGPYLAEQRGQMRAIYLNVGPDRYLPSLLAQPYSINDLLGHAVERIGRLLRYGFEIEAPLYSLGAGELAAMSWLTEAWSQHLMRQSAGERVLDIDFDDLLEQFDSVISKILVHFDLPADSAAVERIAKSSARTRYSKAQEHEFSPDMREQILAQARSQAAEQIRKGTEWLDRAAQRNATANQILAFHSRK